jgi:hypothetical protein
VPIEIEIAEMPKRPGYAPPGKKTSRFGGSVQIEAGTAIGRGCDDGKTQVEGAGVWFIHRQTDPAEHACEYPGITGVFKDAAGRDFLNICRRRHGAKTQS